MRQGALRCIQLELARAAGFPYGSPVRGYQFVAPLDANRHIDLEAWQLVQSQCIVRRFWADEPDRSGRLVRREGEHDLWAFECACGSADGGEAAYSFGAHMFVPGEYVTINSSSGEEHTFRVVSVMPVG